MLNIANPNPSTTQAPPNAPEKIQSTRGSADRMTNADPRSGQRAASTIDTAATSASE